MKKQHKIISLSFAFVALTSMVAVPLLISQPTQAAQESGAVGVEAKISAPPPTQGATISLPREGQVFNSLPITVTGICPKDLLVKLFKNNVFSGSVQCTNGSFSLVSDLFSGRNELVARVYDALDQAGPDSNTVVVTFNDSAPPQATRVLLTSIFAKKGANPGQLLTWPIVLSGGDSPYAISVDWGDGKTPDLISRSFAGTFDISHTYQTAGVYNIIIKATDKNGGVAYLQLVGVANGPLSQDTAGSGASGSKADSGSAGASSGKTIILWQPAALLLPLILLTFWLGKKHELKVLRRKIEQGERPF